MLFGWDLRAGNISAHSALSDSYNMYCLGSSLKIDEFNERNHLMITAALKGGRG